MARVIFSRRFQRCELQSVANKLLTVSTLPTWCFYGSIGAGKTTLISYLIAKLAHVKPIEVCSPTYVYLYEYQDICHFDFYRLPSASECEKMGFDDYFSKTCFIEWPEKIEALLPAARVAVFLQSVAERERKIEVELHGT